MTEEELELVRCRLAERGGRAEPSAVAQVLRELGMVVSAGLVLQTLQALRLHSAGTGPLETLLELPGVTDVLVNGPDQVWFDRGRGLERSAITFTDAGEVRRLAVRLAALAGRRLDEASPCVDARLPEGIRLHAVLAPISEPGPCISLRVPPPHGMALTQWVANGSISPQLADLLTRIVEARASFLVSGGTGSGKTTLLATLLGLVPGDQRMVIVEDARELNPRHEHCVRLQARHPNNEGAGEITMTELVRQALRMRPDRLIVGEVRGAELCDLFTALNTGHEGGCGTIHANSATDLPARLAALAALGGMSGSACRAQAVAALDLVIHVHRDATGHRGVAQIGVLGLDHGELVVQPAVSASPTGLQEGPGSARLREVLDR